MTVAAAGLGPQMHAAQQFVQRHAIASLACLLPATHRRAQAAVAEGRGRLCSVPLRPAAGGSLCELICTAFCWCCVLACLHKHVVVSALGNAPACPAAGKALEQGLAWRGSMAGYANYPGLLALKPCTKLPYHLLPPCRCRRPRAPPASSRSTIIPPSAPAAMHPPRSAASPSTGWVVVQHWKQRTVTPQ